MSRPEREVIGLIPAAGSGTRLGRLPFSKQLYPVGFHGDGRASDLRLKVVSHYLFERMRAAGIRKAYVVLRQGFWDIPAYFGDGRIVDMHLAYLTVESSPNPPTSLDQAFPFVQDAVVALGFPDILFRPADLFVRTVAHQAATDADVVLALVPADRPQDTDMVACDDDGRVRDIVIRPSGTHLRYTWTAAVWTGAFSAFMHEYLAAGGPGRTVEGGRELLVGDVIGAAVRRGVRVESVAFPEGAYLDIGAPDDLARAMRTVSEFDV